MAILQSNERFMLNGCQMIVAQADEYRFWVQPLPGQTFTKVPVGTEFEINGQKYTFGRVSGDFIIIKLA